MRSLLREAPATTLLAALWVAVFVAMIVDQGGLPADFGILTGWVSPFVSRRFGDMTAAQVWAGRIWLALTATFIHYSLLHLALNLLGLIQLGRIIENWYGSAQTVFLYVVIGTLGNLLAALAKPPVAVLLAPLVRIPVAGASGGGSGVLCGYIALLAVVGRRKGTPLGRELSREMLRVLALTAFLGIALPRIDNFGHAGGAILGALMGLLHHTLVRLRATRAARELGLLSGGLLFAAAACQAYYGAMEPLPRSVRLDPESLVRALSRNNHAVQELIRARVIVVEMGLRDRHAPPFDYANRTTRGPSTASIRRALNSSVAAVEASEIGRSDPRDLAIFARVVNAARTRRPSPGEIAAFDQAVGRLAFQLSMQAAAFQALLNEVNEKSRPRTPRANAPRASGSDRPGGKSDPRAMPRPTLPAQ